MFNSTVLEVAIGLVLVYLLLSLVCSAVNEFITRIFEWRSNTLQQGVVKMLDDLKNAQGGQIGTLFYNSPLIKGLTQIRGPFGGSALPTYISARTFSQALLDLVAPSAGAAPQTLNDIRTSVAALPASTMKTALLGMINRAGDDLTKARTSIEHWFDSTMEEVSANYRAWANTILFFVALVVCAVTNADSVQIATQLLQNPALRAAMVASAEEYAKKPLKDGTTPEEQLKDVQKVLGGVEIPLGWKEPEFWGLFDSKKVLLTIEKAFGIVFTTVAVSLGAPFWFDLLNKLVNYRSAAKKPERTDPQKPAV